MRDWLNAVGTFCSAIIAACAFWIALGESWRSEDFNKKSLMPLIVFDFGKNADGFWLNRANIGPGPARIKWMAVTIDGQVKHDWSDALSAMGVKNHASFTKLSPEWWIAKESASVNFVTVPNSEDADLIYRDRGRLNVQICYCTVFDDCEIINLFNHKSQQDVDDCAASKYYQEKIGVSETFENGSI